VDLPAVITLREALLPAHQRAHSVPASLLAPQWVAGIPNDRPTIVFADGLIAFLDEREVIAMVHSITGHFGSGMLSFNDYGPVSKVNRLMGRIATARRGPVLLGRAA